MCRKHPSRAQDDRTRIAMSCSQLAGKFARPIGTYRSRPITLSVWAPQPSIKNIISRNMNEGNADTSRRLRKASHSLTICLEGVGNAFLGEINCSPCRAIDSSVPTAGAQKAPDRFRSAEIKLVTVRKDQFNTVWNVRCCKFEANLSPTADYQNPGHGFIPLTPRRRVASRRARIGSHQSSRSRYHATVAAMPVSKVIRGSQPSSLRILVASMA